MKKTQPAHRPKRQFPEAQRQLCQPELKHCPYCGEHLKSTRTLYVNKHVQTLEGPVNVRAYGYYCPNAGCPHPEVRYRAVKEVLRTSLPHGTYGLDVIAFIGWQRDRAYRQFVEIQELLNEEGVAISERHVGRLYRQYLALLAGMNEELAAQLKETEQSYGGVIWGLDGLQPDQDGTQLYVLYEVLSGTPVGAAWLDKRDAEHLQGWLEPYGALGLHVLATLSDGEDAEVAAMQAVWSEAPHQICQMHALGNMAAPIRAADERLKKVLADHLGPLPPVPGDADTAQAGPAARTLDVVITPTDGEGGSEADTAPTETASDVSETERSGEGEPDPPAGDASRAEGVPAVRMRELELLFRKAFQDALHRPSRKPSTFGGLAGYDQLQSLVCALQFQLPAGGASYLHMLLAQAQRALEETAELAAEVRQASDCLQQVTDLLAVPLATPSADSAPRSRDHPAAAEPPTPGERVRQALLDQLADWAEAPHLGPVSQAFVTNTQRLLDKWGADLFHCYDVPGLPPSNTDLEALFGRLRRGQRRVSGRKQTSELRRTGHFQVLLRAPSFKALWQALCEVPVAAYRAARQRLEAAEERQRWLYRLHRWPAKTAAAMVGEYVKLRRQLEAGMPAGP